MRAETEQRHSALKQNSVNALKTKQRQCAFKTRQGSDQRLALVLNCHVAGSSETAAMRVETEQRQCALNKINGQSAFKNRQGPDQRLALILNSHIPGSSAKRKENCGNAHFNKTAANAL
jgi:hypothetical protein